MRSMRLPASLLALCLASSLACAACDAPSHAPSPSASPSHAPSAEPARDGAAASAAPGAPSASIAAGTADAGSVAKPELMTFQGKLDAHSELRIALERTGTRLVGLYRRSGDAIALRGEMKDATHFTVTEVVPGGAKGERAAKGATGANKKPASIDGQLDGMRLTGTWKDGAVSKPFTAGPLDPFGKDGAKLDLTFEGWLGSKIRIRMKLAKDRGKLAGVYRYTRSKDDLKLAGTVSETDGRLDLRETNGRGTETGRFQGVLLDKDLAFGRWSSPDGAKSMTFSLQAGQTYPEVVKLNGGGRLVPQEDYKDQGPFCTASILFPQITGTKNKAAEQSLDKAIRAIAGDTKNMSCADASDSLRYERDVTYQVTAQRPSRFGLEIHDYDYAGGAHGMSSVECYAADLESGALTHLTAAELTPDARKKLDALVNAALARDNGVTKLTDAGFTSDSVSVSPDTTLCVDGADLVVQFQAYEIAPYAMGAPRVTIAAANAKPLALGAELAKFFE
jgi:hypothetical protein